VEADGVKNMATGYRNGTASLFRVSAKVTGEINPADQPVIGIVNEAKNGNS
jgi:hypothetical protein